MDWKRWLLLIVLLHFGLALVYASITPYRTGGILRFQGRSHADDIGAPDERQHANYVQHLLDGKGIPVFKPGSLDIYETYQSHQPPLYYLLCAGAAKMTGQSDVQQRSTGLVLRGFNGLLGAVAICGVFFIGLWGFRSENIGLGAAAFAGLLPMNVGLSSAITNDVLLILLCTWTLALAAKGARDGWNIKIALGIGLLAGLAMLTKTTALALIFAVPFFFLTKTDDGKSKVDVKPLLTSFAVMLVLAVPWWLRNKGLYGDPFAMKAFTEAFQGSPKANDFIRELGPMGYWSGMNDTPLKLGVLTWTFKSLFGVFGYMDIFLADPLYWIFGLGMATLLFFTIKGRGRPEVSEAAPVRHGLTVFFIVVLALFMRFNSEYFQAQARYLLPALASLSIAAGCGITALASQKPKTGIAILACTLLASNLYVISILPDEFKLRVDTLTTSAWNSLAHQNV